MAISCLAGPSKNVVEREITQHPMLGLEKPHSYYASAIIASWDKYIAISKKIANIFPGDGKKVATIN